MMLGYIYFSRLSLACENKLVWIDPAMKMTPPTTMEVVESV